MSAATKATHTPGPWHRNIRAGGKYPVVFAGRNQHVAQVVQQADPAETEANIDLIAAVTELLAALRGFVDGCQRGVFRNDVYKRTEAETILRIAIAAIVKATEGTP